MDREAVPFAYPLNAKVPWCHFNIDVAGTPDRLREISRDAGLDKKGVSLTVLVVAKETETTALDSGKDGTPVRIVSEEFSLPGGWAGRYGCSAFGYTLVRYDGRGRASARDGRESGSLLPGDLIRGRFGNLPETDMKSGAVICSV
jgi:hypothetical protein